jgi:predicted RNase H-like HicB family nuclease
MKTYIALFEYDDDGAGYSVVFPDFPGLISAGDDYGESLRMAHDGLAAHVRFLTREGDHIPAPRTLEEIEATWPDWPEWRDNYKFLLVPISLATKIPAPYRAPREKIPA